ncbi:MAG: diguanylate cyclase [Phycisphaerales bacterium]|nr:diguanylate cyclase [Phycisphaerales bacterium]
MTPSSINPTDRNPGVLLIDDSEFVHRLLKARLKSESIRLVSAFDGNEGVGLAKKELPSLILLDLDMPVMDGFETLRALMDEPTTRNIPVIILSGQDTTQDKVTAFDLGAVDFVSKPFELTELRARLRSSLRISSLMRMLEQRAQIDGLTGLYNRAYFNNRWEEEHSRALRHGNGLSLVMLDIDHFKSVNDNYGHPAGDAVIAGVADILQGHIRKSDIACRYGGEEFVLILPETDPEKAKGLCERIREDIEGMSWPMHPDRNITISMGIAGATGAPTQQVEPWIAIADSNLYRAKEAGRNQIVCSETPGSLNQAG